ncbi:glutathione S-transferase E14-like isoform X3 [Toxorhynchites rutilus septentrionalis]|uniref:glutathione S-transferase E14-like isoform X3 n=1 Tax=Toxorhynchites rutilus septentrionalis TaxID=329112 RepID=UPI00247AB48B|nr:glutathione S-transferase E14-like isoform X3 [Toxorhynchites rutilus septentrionalis]
MRLSNLKNFLKMSKPILYYDDVSPPVRSVLLTVAALDIKDKVDLNWIELFAGAHLQKEFREINPLHTVPVLVHDDLVITDSHAILMYLCDVYGRDSKFSLEDPRRRASVMNRLCFNNSVLFRRDSEIMRKIFHGEITDVSGHLDPIREALDYLEVYLGKTKFIACDELTVADLSNIATLSTLEIICPLAGGRWPKVEAWSGSLKQLPYYHEANQVGLNKLREKLVTLLKL